MGEGGLRQYIDCGSIFCVVLMGHVDWTMITRAYDQRMPDADPTAGAEAQAQFASSVAGRTEPV